MKIYYFSKSGNCKRIATEIEHYLQGRLLEITDDVDWRKFTSLFSIHAYRKKKKNLSIHVDEKPDANEEIIVVTPLWGGLITPTVAKFLEDVPKNKVHLITSSITDYPRDVDEFLSVTSIIKRKGNEKKALESFYSLVNN